jgi:hypothetical protein
MKPNNDNGPFPKSVFPISVFPRRLFPWMGGDDDKDEDNEDTVTTDGQRSKDAGKTK